MILEELMSNEHVELNHKKELSLQLRDGEGPLISMRKAAEVHEMEITNLDTIFTLILTQSEMEAMAALVVRHWLATLP